jgi:hypothetical protein
MFKSEICLSHSKNRFLKKIFVTVIIFTEVFSFYGCKGLIDNGENKVPLDTSQILESESTSVQNGHLGNYSTVTVGEVFDSIFLGGEWRTFVGTSDNNSTPTNIAQFQGTWTSVGTMLIQFRVNDDNTFTVVHYAVDGTAKSTPYNIKKDLDELYGFYLKSHPDSGIVVDYSTKNDTLHGICAPD